MSDEYLERPDRELNEFHGMYTVAPEMRELFAQVEKAAADDTAIVVRGETGTGKEHVARALHRMSSRSRGPFRALNCATLTGDLLASELFGHKEGAFTGAISDRAGLFEQADGGTVFLDEIAELPMEFQARLLRVLEQQEFVPVGGQNPVSVDIRLVSATHRSLRRAVDEGDFRQDLMYRVRVVPLFIPRLVDRTGDIEALTWHFIDVLNGKKRRQVEFIEPSAMDLLGRHHWPGNVRELRNALEYSYVLGEGEVLESGELPPELRGESPPEQRDRLPNASESDEKRRIRNALEEAGGNRTRAADLLDVSRTTLWRKIKEYGLD
jgi:transcriptional regulator with PAS, ATPase and Fis domain